MNVLLVESDSTCGASLRLALENAGHCLVWTGNDVQAVECASSTDYDALILGLGVADPDGLSLCAKLRRVSSALPILVLAAGDRVADRLAAFTAGADDVLTKPFDVDEMLARLAAIRRRHAPQATRSGACPDHMIVVDRTERAAQRSRATVRLTDRERRLFELVLGFRTGAGSLSSALLDTHRLEQDARVRQTGIRTMGPRLGRHLDIVRTLGRRFVFAGARFGRRSA